MEDYIWKNKIEFGISLPYAIPTISVPCLQCGERLKNGAIGFCSTGCADAWQFRLDVGAFTLEADLEKRKSKGDNDD